MKAESQWDCNNFFEEFIKGSFPFLKNTLWVSTSLTQFMCFLCLPSLPVNEFLFPRPCQISPLLRSLLWSTWAASSSAPNSWYSPLLKQGTVYSGCMQICLPCEAVYIPARAVSYAALWHSTGHPVTHGCVCCFDHVSAYWKLCHWYWHWPPACGSLLLAAASVSFLILPLAWMLLLLFTHHLLPSSDCPALLVSFMDTDRKFLLLAELSLNKVVFREDRLG